MTATRMARVAVLACGVMGMVAHASAAEQAYDPLRLSQGGSVRRIDLSVKDTGRDRTVPILVYLAEETGMALSERPVVLFSHGLGGSREGNRFLGEHWAGRGYVAVFLQHPGSDDAVWKDVPLLRRMAAMREAANGRNLLLRLQDVAVVLDQLALWQKEAGHPLQGRMQLSQIGMSGHSFGAQTTQAVSGQSLPLVGRRSTDARIKAAIAFSPSTPVGQEDPQRVFGSVSIPWLLMTGTLDTAPVGGQTVESRLKVYPALPPGDKYELVLHEASHYAFTDADGPGEQRTRNPNHHRVILAFSTAFWDAYLKNDPLAKAWLSGGGAAGLLEAQDRWQTK